MHAEKVEDFGRLENAKVLSDFPLANPSVSGLDGGTRNSMNVSMWMTRDVLTVTPDTPVVEAARIMAGKKVRRLLVATQWPDGRHLLGIVSTRDVLHTFPPHVNPFAIVAPDPRQTPTKVSEIMTSAPLTTTPETPIETAAALMCAQKIGALPVLRGHVVAGIITESDIFRAFTSLFPHDEKGVRITFDATKGEDVFGLLAGICQRHEVKISSLIWTVHDELPVCVVRASGAGTEKMLEELWNSGHAVENVIRFEGDKSQRVFPPVSMPPKPRSSTLKDDPGSELYSST
jgi:acetoin utilization protein AcuB